MPKAIIFDIDGTLLDSVDQHAESWKRSFEHFGFRFSFPEIRAQIGKGGDKLLQSFLTDEEIKTHGKNLEKFRGDLFESEFLKQVKPFPCVPELFRKLRDLHYRIGLATSATGNEVEKYERILGIEGLSEATTTKDDVKNSKPEPDVLKIVRDRLGNVAASDCIFIGDSPFDAEAAAKDGMPMIAVLCGGFAEQDLRASGAGQVFQSPQDLYENWKI